MTHSDFLKYLTDFLDYNTDLPSTERRQRRVLEAANGGMQELISLAPPGMFADRRGFLLKAPETFDVAATEAGHDLTDWTPVAFGTDAIGDWMRASTIRIAGDASDNEIRKVCPQQFATGTSSAFDEDTGQFTDSSATFLDVFPTAETPLWVRVDLDGLGDWVSFQVSSFGQTYLVIPDAVGAYSSGELTTKTYEVVAAAEEPADWDSLSSWTARLVRPYAGSTGTHSATVWDDALVLPADVLEIVGKVMADGVELEAVNGRRLLYLATTDENRLDADDYGLLTPTSNRSRRVVRRTGRPTAYATEYYTENQDVSSRLVVHFDTLPTAITRIDLEVKRLPAVFTFASFDDDLDGQKLVAFPYEAVEGCAIPFAVQRLVKDLDFTMVRDEVSEKSENILAETYRQYVEAREIIENWTPRIMSNTRLRPRNA